MIDVWPRSSDKNPSEFTSPPVLNLQLANPNLKETKVGREHLMFLFHALMVAERDEPGF